MIQIANSASKADARIKTIVDIIPDHDLEQYVNKSEEIIHVLISIINMCLAQRTSFFKEDLCYLFNQIRSISLILMRQSADVSSIEYFGSFPCHDAITVSISYLKSFIIYLNTTVRDIQSLQYLRMTYQDLVKAHREAMLLKDWLMSLTYARAIVSGVEHERVKNQPTQGDATPTTAPEDTRSAG